MAKASQELWPWGSWKMIKVWTRILVADVIEEPWVLWKLNKLYYLDAINVLVWGENDTPASHCGFACVRQSGCSSKILDTYDKKCDRLIFLKGRASNSRLNKKENLIRSNLSPPPVCLAVTWFKLLGLEKLSFVKGICGFLIKPLSCVILSLHGCCWLVQFLSFFFFPLVL